jgi:hypothetical protein
LTGHERRLANLRPFQKGNTFGKGSFGGITDEVRVLGPRKGL